MSTPNTIEDLKRTELTLRDRFAIAALTGFCAHLGVTAPWQAANAYEMADAMLAEREKEVLQQQSK